MALIDCPECAGKLSTRASSCPHCGMPVRPADTIPTLSDKIEPMSAAPIRGDGVPKWIKACGLGGVLFFVGWNVLSPSASSAPTNERSQAAATAAAKCDDTSAHCALMDARTDITVACQQDIERKMLYQYRWTTGWGRMAFNRSTWDDEGDKVLLAAGDALEVQNQFGAFVNQQYFCRIHLPDAVVRSTTVLPGRFGADAP